MNAKLTVTRCTFSQNTATLHGGAIYAIGATVKATQSSFFSNSATYVSSDSGVDCRGRRAPMTLACVQTGGAMLVTNTGGTPTGNPTALTLQCCSFDENDAGTLGNVSRAVCVLLSCC